MSSLIDVSALTLNPQEATEVSEVVFEKVFVQTDLAQIHEIEVGVQMQQQIVFSNQLGIGGEALTGCTPEQQAGLELTQKYWTPQLIAGRLVHCQNDLNKLFKLFTKVSKANPDYFDKEGSQELGMVTSAVIESMKTSIHAKIWYSDTSADDFSGGGNFTNGTNLGLFNQFDGLWKQIFADSDIPRYTISENSGASASAQVLADGKAHEILKAMYNGADARLLGSDGVQFVVTRSIYDNYLDFLETKENSGGFIQVTEDGRQQLFYRSIPVIMDNEFDRIQNLYQNNGTVTFRPHRAILTVKENIPVATLSEQDLSNLESWYEKKDKSNYIDYAYFLDAKHLESYMSSVAY